MALKRVGILTGGGDCSGLNAVIRAVTRTAIIQYGAEVLGLENGFDGLIFGRTMKLTTRALEQLAKEGAAGDVFDTDLAGYHVRGAKRGLTFCLYLGA